MEVATTERPVYVEFETRAVEDREASVKEGRYVGKDQDWAVITPPGGNLSIERPADEWLGEKDTAGDPHAARYRQAYEAWKVGQEPPEDGTPIKDWPSLSPAQVQACLAANVRSVEDLAGASDSTLERIGPGARALMTKAQTWLQSAENLGKVSEEIAALGVRLETLEREAGEKDEKIAEQAAEIATLKAAMPAPKTEEAPPAKKPAKVAKKG